jgi:hypothetical protein
MQKYSIWLLGFACGLITPVALHFFVYDAAIGVGAAFGILILIAVGAQRMFRRGEHT